eukprot:1160367-Pelagomonas_calceolata.AAC.4
MGAEGGGGGVSLAVLHAAPTCPCSWHPWHPTSACLLSAGDTGICKYNLVGRPTSACLLSAGGKSNSATTTRQQPFGKTTGLRTSANHGSIKLAAIV